MCQECDELSQAPPANPAWLLPMSETDTSGSDPGSWPLGTWLGLAAGGGAEAREHVGHLERRAGRVGALVSLGAP